MIRSMTAYSLREIKGDWGSAIWELRSVNHRYLEISFHLPEHFRSLQPVLCEFIHSRITRGKIDCNLYYKTDINIEEEFIFNEKLAEKLINSANWIKNKSKEGKINPVSILHWPGVMEVKRKNINSISNKILDTFNNVLDDFIITRETEGQSLKALIEKRLKSVNLEVKKIRTHMPEILEWQHKRLTDKLKAAEIHIENHRLEQELIFLAQRIDITEELDRLEAHVKETFNILNRNDAIGRRLDFMMQEFNRESNTLASKAIDIDITKSAIELKVLIEQIREQVQNIE